MTPAEHVIEKFGGLTKLARALDCAVSTVQGWKERGRIPQEHWLGIIAAGKAQGVDLSLEDFLMGAGTAEPPESPSGPLQSSGARSSHRAPAKEGTI